MPRVIYNIILASSHIFGIQLFKSSNTLLKNIFYATILCTSTLMHISDRKHGLPGVPILNSYHKLFLNLDRFTAMSGVIYSVYKFSQLLMNNNIERHMILDSIIGLSALFLSENYHLFYKHNTKIIFHTITHVIWHYYAFKLLGSF